LQAGESGGSVFVSCPLAGREIMSGQDTRAPTKDSRLSQLFQPIQHLPYGSLVNGLDRKEEQLVKSVSEKSCVPGWGKRKTRSSPASPRQLFSLHGPKIETERKRVAHEGFNLDRGPWADARYDFHSLTLHV